MEKEAAKGKAGDSHAAEAGSHLSQEAMNDYHVCKDGTVVSKPSDCWKVKHLPDLEIHGV